MKMIKKRIEDAYQVGDRIHFISWKQLLINALFLSSEGYGVSVVGFEDMSANCLTITALPERKSNE